MKLIHYSVLLISVASLSWASTFTSKSLETLTKANNLAREDQIQYQTVDNFSAQHDCVQDCSVDKKECMETEISNPGYPNGKSLCQNMNSCIDVCLNKFHACIANCAKKYPLR